MMRAPAGILTAACSLVVLCAAVGAAQRGTGIVRVEVTDNSGGRLPGVAVVATAVDGHVFTAATDRTGVCVFRAVPTGPAMLRLRLEGFAGVLVGVTVQPDTEARVVQRLDLAPLAETVVVEAPAPVEPPRPPPPPPAPAPPLVPLRRPVPPHDPDSVCGPAKPDVAAESLGTIKSTRYVAEGGLYTTGGQILVDGGTRNGLEVGQNLVVRHYFRARRLAGSDATGEHTAGVVQIVGASERSSIAVVVYACDELRAGDFLATFKPEPIRSPEPRGVPNYDSAARVLFADEGQLLAAPQRLMVIDRGSQQGLRVGQRMTLFRRHGTTGPEIVGDAVVVALRIDSATIRVDRVNDTISSGDMAAPQTPALPY
jgi:carboxypeptidase family protein